ncbi:MAG TPA: nitrite reductase small subunit NirD [Polyangiaceae bacterium]|jgi:nitrite reductase (NADH) small subunit|nr:nitrite reductase small subunit NirD [Polyangiaceae bacterium]
MLAFAKPQQTAAETLPAKWEDVCSIEEIPRGAGVAALVDGRQVALLRSRDGGRVYALSNFDPFSKAFVIARGIIGDRAGVPKVASPMYKHSFDLKSGRCLDDASVRLDVYPVAVVRGRVLVGSMPDGVPA